MPSEDSSAAPKLEDTQASRRHFLPKLARSILHSTAVTEGVGLARDFTRIGVTPFAAWILTQGMHTPEGAINYLKRKDASGAPGRIHFIPSAHAMPDDDFIPSPDNLTNNQVLAKVAERDPHASVWPQSTQEIIDANMRQAAQEGRQDYFLASDGAWVSLDIPLGGSMLPLFPLPRDLRTENQHLYPKRYHAIGADEFGEDFAIGFLAPESDPDLQKAFKKISTTVHDWFDPYTQKKQGDMTLNWVENTAKAVLDVAVAEELIRKTTDDVTRKTFLNSLFWTIAAIKIGGVTSLFNELTHFVGNDKARDILTVLQSTTGEELPDDIFSFWILARTAFVAEKCDFISRQNNNIPVDVVMGDMHAQQAPLIFTSHEARMQIIEHFMTLFSKKIAATIAADYPMLKNQRDKILYFALSSIACYSITEVNIPWGHPDKLPDEYNAKAGPSYYGYCPDIYALAKKVLDSAGVNTNKFPPPSVSTGDDPWWTNGQRQRDYSK